MSPLTLVKLGSPLCVQPVKSPVSKPPLTTRQAGVPVGVGVNVAVAVDVAVEVAVAVGVNAAVAVGVNVWLWLWPLQ